MIKQIVQVILGREVLRTVPGVGWKENLTLNRVMLSFYKTGTDLPLAFAAEDVREVIIPNDPETVIIFAKALFKVIIQNW